MTCPNCGHLLTDHRRNGACMVTVSSTPPTLCPCNDVEPHDADGLTRKPFSDTPEQHDLMRLLALLIGALREAGELNEDDFETGEPQWIAEALERLKARALRASNALALLDEFDRYASSPPDNPYAGSPFQDRVRGLLCAREGVHTETQTT